MVSWRGSACLLLAFVIVSCGGASRHERGDEARETGGGGGTGGTGGGSGGNGGSGEDAGAPSKPILGITALARGDGVFVAAGVVTRGSVETGVIFRSTDGSHWTKVADGLAFNPSDIEYGNGRFVTLGTQILAGEPTSEGYVSDDGEHWNEARPPTQSVGEHFAFGNDAFVVGSREGLLSSPDGETWTNSGIGQQSYVGANVDFAGDRFLGWWTGSPMGFVGTSDTWAPVSLAGGSPAFLPVEVGTLNGRFVGSAAYDPCFGEVPLCRRFESLSSSNGVDWSFGEPTNSQPPLPVIENEGVCIALGQFDVEAGPTCDELTVVFSAPGFQPRAALAAGGIYLIAGWPSGGIISSHDGLTWTPLLEE